MNCDQNKSVYSKYCMIRDTDVMISILERDETIMNIIKEILYMTKTWLNDYISLIKVGKIEKTINYDS